MGAIYLVEFMKFGDLGGTRKEKFNIGFDLFGRTVKLRIIETGNGQHFAIRPEILFFSKIDRAKEGTGIARSNDEVGDLKKSRFMDMD